MACTVTSSWPAIWVFVKPCEVISSTWISRGERPLTEFSGSASTDSMVWRAASAAYATLGQLAPGGLAKGLGWSGTSGIGCGRMAAYRRNVAVPADSRADVLLVCSPGGHALQLHMLRKAWSGYRTLWVTLDAEDTRSLLRGERISFAHGPTMRNLPNFFRNLLLALRLLRRVRPRVVVTTGAGLAVPFAWIGRLFGARVVYVESLTRIDAPSLSCRLIAPVADRVYAQWPELRHALPGSRFVGSVLSPP